MGCDAYVIDPKKSASVEIVCYGCGGIIHPDGNADFHTECPGNDERVRVSFELVNLEER